MDSVLWVQIPGTLAEAPDKNSFSCFLDFPEVWWVPNSNQRTPFKYFERNTLWLMKVKELQEYNALVYLSKTRGALNPSSEQSLCLEVKENVNLIYKIAESWPSPD